MRPETAPSSWRAGQVDEAGHTWLGVVGPHPAVISVISCSLLAAVFAHLLVDLPPWWPFAAGAVALAFNAGVAYWQAGAVRVVAVTPSGIQVLRKARWSQRCTHLVGTMPRMPLGPLSGRWSRCSIANTVLWIHRRHHPTIADFDAHHRKRFVDLLAEVNGPVRSSTGRAPADGRAADERSDGVMVGEPVGFGDRPARSSGRDRL
ncbi:MAG: hypothetical protein WBM50_10915 [Acidimicrobiales bacterium]